MYTLQYFNVISYWKLPIYKWITRIKMVIFQFCKLLVSLSLPEGNLW